MIRDQNLKDCAAICSAHAAKIYGLNVLEEGIEDDKINFTGFFFSARLRSIQRWIHPRRQHQDVRPRSC